MHVVKWGLMMTSLTYPMASPWMIMLSKLSWPSLSNLLLACTYMSHVAIDAEQMPICAATCQEVPDVEDGDGSEPGIAAADPYGSEELEDSPRIATDKENETSGLRPPGAELHLNVVKNLQRLNTGDIVTCPKLQPKTLNPTP